MAEIVAKKGGRLHGRRYLCGVEYSECSGSYVTTPSGPRKAHGSSEEAFKCMAAYLLRQGFTQVGGREFAAPNNGPIRVLTKKSRFGFPLRPGKENRWMHRRFPGGGVGSV